jgi:acetyltransferase
MAIRPYPRELETTAVLRSGLSVVLRPIRPEDATALGGMFARCRQEDLYLRFLQGLRRLPDELAARLTQIDYEREMAFVAFADERNDADMLGVVHLVATPDRDSAEFAVIVRSDMKGKGLGWCLMNHILDYAAQHGVKQVYGHVLRDNAAMLQMSRQLGFEIAPPDEGNMVRVVRRLSGAG